MKKQKKEEDTKTFVWMILLIITIATDIILMCDIGGVGTIIITFISMLSILGMMLLEEKENGRINFGMEKTFFFLTILIIIIKIIRI